MTRGCWAGLSAVCIYSISAFGAGFQLYSEGSAEALGQAAAVSGRNDLISLAWYNPSALAGAARTEIMAGSVFVQLQTDFRSSIDPAYNSSMDEDWRTIPHVYFVQPLSTNLTATLSVNAPYGLITEWPSGWAGNVAATYSEFSAIYTTPALAYRVNEQLALAAGFNVVYADAELLASRDFSGVGGPDFGMRSVQGDDWGYGYTASAHGRFGDNWSIGARFQSRVKIKLQGHVDFQSNPVPPNKTSFPGSAEVELPSSISVGLVNRSFERFQLGLDVVWTEWSTYDALVYRFGSGYPSTAVTPNPEVNAKRWDDVWSIRVGSELELSEAWVARAGYVWDQSPVDNATRSPELPGSDRQMLTAGAGWKHGPFGIDIAYAYLWADSSRSGPEVVASVPTLSGSYKNTTHIVGMSVWYIF